MKNLLKKFLVTIAVIMCASATFSFTTPEAASAASDCRDFLGMVSWDCHTGLNSGTTPNENTLKTGIWVAVANVVTDITVIAAYLVLGYVIYGGYLYMFSGGDPGKVANGKKTLTQAFIGLAIVMSANAILNTIRIALGANFAADCTVANSACPNPGVMVTNAISWIVGVAGVVSVIFVVYGGVAYITSSGDPSKLQKAKSAITYALIGLVIVALAETITAFVSNMIREANAYNNETTISKEIHEKNH